MLKNLKKAVSLVLVLALSVVVSLPAFAQDQQQINLKDYISKRVNGVQVENQYKLYDLNDNVTAYLFTLKTGGYVIMNAKDYSIPEYSLISETHYSLDGNKMYYGGILNYYESSGNRVRNVLTKEPINTQDKELISNYSKNSGVSGKLQSTAISPMTTYYYFITGDLPNYSYNPDGRCGVTASAMWLRYYDIYKNSNYVPTSLESSDGVKLINYLYPYIQNAGGSYPGGVTYGLDDYLSEQGISAGLSMDNANIGIIAGYVSGNKPYILFINTSKYGYHVVTGYGYSTGSGTDYAVVNDGWGSTGIYINLANASEVIG